MENPKLTLGFSPCPNDTFIFDAIVHEKIDTEGLSFNVVMADVEELNQKAFRNELDVTKLSFSAYINLADNYNLLDSGSALGSNCGPLLIANSKLCDEDINYNRLKIAIPGKYTMANFLLSLAFPGAKNKTEMLFSEIEEAILNGIVDAGVIIHESRFTYQDKGLIKIADLGEYWEGLTKLPVPLGGIVIRKDLPSDIHEKMNRIMRKSVEYAMGNPGSSADFVKSNAQEMSEEVINKHIELYVNDYTIELGEKGIKAIKKMIDLAKGKGLIDEGRCY